MPEARGASQRLVLEAEAYKAQVVARAEGEASRFISVHTEYLQARNVTRRRIYLETMESIFSGMSKIIIDDDAGTGVVPYLPLPEIQARRGGNNGGGND